MGKSTVTRFGGVLERRWAMPRSKNTESWTEESRANPLDPAAGCGLFGREEEALQGVA